VTEDCGELLERFTEYECRNYIRRCGYRYTQTEFALATPSGEEFCVSLRAGGAPVKVPQKSAESARGGASFARQLSSRLTFVTRVFGATFAFFRNREIDAKVAKVQNSRRAQNSSARLTRRAGAEGKIEMPKSGRDVRGSR
jgi:hypothetical protein